MIISIDYANALMQAKKLEDAANDCAEILRGIDRQLSAVEGTWEGSAADAYKAKLNELKQQNTKIQSEIREAATSIREVARIIREADEAAAANDGGAGGGGGGGGGGAFLTRG